MLRRQFRRRGKRLRARFEHGRPEDDALKWRSYLLRLLPIADPARMEKLFEAFRNAGRPV
jgi:hypothetical protein